MSGEPGSPPPETRKPHPVLLWGLVGFMTICWGLNPIIGKVALREFPPLLLLAVRTTIAAGLMLPIFFLQGGAARRISAVDWPRLVAFGLVLQVGNQALFVSGLNHTSVAHAAFIYSLTPIIVLCLAAGLGQEHITARKVAGMAVCICGVLLLTRDKGGAGAEPTLLGDALMLGATLFFSSFTVLSRPMRGRYGPIAMNTIAYVSGAIALQPLIWIVYGDVRLFEISFDAWAALLYMATLPAIVGYLIYYWALGHAPASKIAVLQYVQPPFATFLGVLLLGETVTNTLLVAGGLILAGVILAERSRR